MRLSDRIKAAIRDVENFPKEGIIFKDITPILQDSALCADIVEALYLKFQNQQVDCIAAIESRGFFFGVMLAQKFGVPFVPIRKKGKLPYKTKSHSYNLEYGSAIIEMHEDAIEDGSHVLIHDDLLATGGTAEAAAELIQENAHVAGFSFVVGLNFLEGEKLLSKYGKQVDSLVAY